MTLPLLTRGENWRCRVESLARDFESRIFSTRLTQIIVGPTLRRNKVFRHWADRLLAVFFIKLRHWDLRELLRRYLAGEITVYFRTWWRLLSPSRRKTVWSPGIFVKL